MFREDRSRFGADKLETCELQSQISLRKHWGGFGRFGRGVFTYFAGGGRKLPENIHGTKRERSRGLNPTFF